jgi:hypothetical protein
MNNQAIVLKVKERLNKLDSQDYDNVDDWKIIEAFNKGTVEWCRRQLRGANQFRDGDEQSKRRIDDLQILLVPELSMPSNNRQTFYETQDELPDDYFEYKRVDIDASTECCNTDDPFVVYLAEEDNRALLLRDHLTKPSYHARETFATMIGNKIRVYTNGEFNIDDIRLTYYRQPTRIEIAGVSNPYTGVISTADVESDFKDDIVELLADEAAAILGGDIESGLQYQRGSQSAERNN